MARRQHLTLMVILAVAAFFSLTYMLSDSGRSDRYPVPYKEGASSSKQQPSSKEAAPAAGEKSSFSPDLGSLEGVLTGGSIAPKLENATAKAELGRATWKFLHTMVARFPESPTPDDSLALKTFIHLFARLYPCGDCASHFQKLLAKYPPQVSGRNAAAGWACFVHNEVNQRLKKEVFDCNKIGDFYDCGCGEEGKKGGEKKDGEKKDGEKEAGELKERKGGEDGSVTLVKEGLVKGG